MAETITRAHLAEMVYRNVGLTYSESSDMVDAVLEEVIQSLIKDEQVKLSSFGTFEVRQKKQRMGRNPKTKEQAVISPRKVVSFHASNILKNKINEANN